MLIEAAIPGMRREDVSVEVAEGVLTIQGTSNQHGDIKDGQYVKRQIKRSAFSSPSVLETIWMSHKLKAIMTTEFLL